MSTAPITAKSSLTASLISNTPALWTNLQGPIVKGQLAGHSFQVLSADANTAFTVSSGNLLVLGGLFYKGSEDKQYSSAHITITPDSLGEWTYFHFTLVGQQGRTAYYYLIEDSNDELAIRPTVYTLLGGKKQAVNGTQYYWNNPPDELRQDLEVIIKAFIRDNYEAGEAIQ